MIEALKPVARRSLSDGIVEQITGADCPQRAEAGGPNPFGEGAVPAVRSGSHVRPGRAALARRDGDPGIPRRRGHLRFPQSRPLSGAGVSVEPAAGPQGGRGSGGNQADAGIAYGLSGCPQGKERRPSGHRAGPSGNGEVAGGSGAIPGKGPAVPPGHRPGDAELDPAQSVDHHPGLSAGLYRETLASSPASNSTGRATVSVAEHKEILRALKKGQAEEARPGHDGAHPFLKRRPAEASGEPHPCARPQRC